MGSASQPPRRSLTNAGVVECSLDKVSSQLPQYFVVALFCPQGTQLGLQGLVIDLKGYEVCRHTRLEIYVTTQNEHKWGDEGSAISKHAKRAEYWKDNLK